MPGQIPNEQIVYGHSKSDTERIANSVLFTESQPQNTMGMRRQRHFRGGGKSIYNGYFKVVDITDYTAETPTYEVQIFWGDGDDAFNIGGFCEINGIRQTVGQLTLELAETNCVVYIQWEWDTVEVELKTPPTLQETEYGNHFPPAQVVNYLKWPLAWVKVVNDKLVIKQLWLGGYFQASLWGEC